MTPTQRLISRALRLNQLRELNAPSVIITNEQRLVLEAATALCFPSQ
jgi:DNA-directed RNA polymerase beta' subunit